MFRIGFWSHCTLLCLITTLVLSGAGLAAPGNTDGDVGEGVDVVVEEKGVDEEPISEEETEKIWRQVDANLQRLQAGGRLPGVSAASPVLLEWPLRPHAGEAVTDPYYASIASLVDHEAAYPKQVRDYTCGVQSYDTSGGYNHKGTDILIAPFPWLKMDNDEVAVIAGAPGTIIYRRDGEYDRSCGGSGSPWNAVFVRHGDGSTAWYGHLKNGSLTSKQVGDWVEVGEYLGIVGSSGFSTGPHLHFELYDAGGKLVDPFAGACNATTDRSWWREQPGYQEAGVNKLMTGTAPPGSTPCPGQEIPHRQNRFDPGDRIYFTGYFRHISDGETLHYELRRPDGSLFRQWSYTRSGKNMILGWIYRYYTLPASAPVGTWRFSVRLGAETFEHTFQVGQAATPSEPTATPSPSATVAPSPTSSPSATFTPTELPSPTATLTVTAIVTPRAGATATLTATTTPEVSPTSLVLTPNPAGTARPARTPTATPPPTVPPTPNLPAPDTVRQLFLPHVRGAR